MFQSIGSQRIKHDLATELNTWEAKYCMSIYNYGASLVAQMIKNLPRML